MSLLTLLTETRGIGVNTPEVGIGTDAFYQLLTGGNSLSFAGEPVSEETAMGVTAVFQAVNILSNTMAVLPLKVYKNTPTGRVSADNDPLYPILHDAVNSNFLTSYMWRKMMMQRALIGGRAYSYIERNNAGRVRNIWYLNPDYVKVLPTPDGLGKFYRFTQPNNQTVDYQAEDIIDICWIPAANGIDHISPINLLRNAIGLSISAEKFASTVFEQGGVPQLAITGPLSSPDAAARAGKMIKETINSANRDKRPFTVLPDGYDVKAIGFDPSKSQLLELRKFQVIEIARIYNISPSLLMDMSSGTFTNVEMQDTAFSKHTVHHWTELWESELNVKLTGPRNKTTVIEFSMDGLQRGDYSSRSTALAQRIQNGLLTPNEGRALDNLPAQADGDQLFIQGATVPLSQAGKAQAAKADPADTTIGDQSGDIANSTVT